MKDSPAPCDQISKVFVGDFWSGDLNNVAAITNSNSFCAPGFKGTVTANKFGITGGLSDQYDQIFYIAKSETVMNDFNLHDKFS